MNGQVQHLPPSWHWFSFTSKQEVQFYESQRAEGGSRDLDNYIQQLVFKYLLTMTAFVLTRCYLKVQYILQIKVSYSD